MRVMTGPLTDVRFGSRAAAWLAVALGVAVVAADVILYPRLRDWHIASRSALRLGMALASIIATRTLSDRHAPLVRWWPPRARRWLLAGALSLGVAVVIGLALPEQRGAIDVEHWLISGVLVAPIVEEALYRQALMVPIIAVVGRLPAVILSATAFAYLHVVYGNAMFTNAIGGVALAAIFATTQSWPTTVIAHAIGNLAILIINVLVAS
jgi:membrane protease YdiL (CAAX protease family)